MWIFILLYLGMLSYYDWREKKVPVLLLCFGIVVAIMLSIVEGTREKQIWYQILGWLPGIFLCLVAAFTKKMGYADGIVLAVVGSVLGYRMAVMTFCVSLVLVSTVSVVMLFLRRVSANTQIPYIPFLTTAFLILQFGGVLKGDF